MCTVTIFHKGDDDFVLTSNRDEAPNRNTLKPDFYLDNKVQMLYPKDEIGGGTWIGLSEKNRLVCLLNGAFDKHKREDNYKHSRGIVVKELLASNDVESCMQNFNLNNIEPFTIVIADWNEELRFFEWIWDGSQKHFKELALQTYIWSSSTLYDEEMKSIRHNWFKDFKEDNNLTAESILKFHLTETQNMDFGIVMDRGFVKTTSITQVEKTGDKIIMRYNDLIKNEVSKIDFSNHPTTHE